jgi:hypothetical protein
LVPDLHRRLRQRDHLLPVDAARRSRASDGWRRHVVTEGTVRYNDDAGFEPDITWAELIEEHGDELISQIRVVAGCSGDYSEGSTAYVDDIVLDAVGETARFDFGS